MDRAFRAFLWILAAASTATAVTLYLRVGDYSLEGLRGIWWLLGSTACSYIVVACAYSFAKTSLEGPNRRWLAAVFGLSLALPLGPFRMIDDLPTEVPAYLALVVLPLCAYLGATALLLYEFRCASTPGSNRVLRALLPASLSLGAALVLCSLFLRTTFGEGRGSAGIHILTRQAQWVTAGINVAHGVFGPVTAWLNVFYVVAGYPIYLLSVLTSVATLVGLILSRFSMERFQTWPLFLRAAALAIWSSLFVISDIFWGWHFDLSGATWAAALATALWLATPLGGALLLLPLARGRPAAGALSTLLILQLPLAAFNVLMLPVYFRPSSIADLPGLGCLILGLLIQSLVYTELLVRKSKKAAAITKLPEVAAKAA